MCSAIGCNQNGSNLLRNFADSMGNRAVNWLNDRANGVLNRLMDNPFGQRVNSFLNSGFGQIYYWILYSEDRLKFLFNFAKIKRLCYNTAFCFKNK